MKKVIFFIAGGVILAALAVVAIALLTKNPPPPRAEALGQAAAVEKVRALPEVAAYEVMLKNAGKKASFEAQEDGGDWSVQVFEIVQNDNEPSHTATFGWYRVNKQTGAIIKDL